MQPLKSLEEALHSYQEMYGETYCQHKSEMAAFGDSWPGAKHELDSMDEEINKLKALIAAHPDTIARKKSEEKEYAARQIAKANYVPEIGMPF